MEMLELSKSFWNGKRVFLTGHTGFKGGWLALWLSKMGAHVFGYSLDPGSCPCLFDVLKLNEHLSGHFIQDIRDTEALDRAIKIAAPEIVFHLAAQPLVRVSYVSPVDTYSVNVMGTVNLLDAVRRNGEVGAVVVVTTDKCYDNQEWIWPYRETDRLGGHDPYASSKSCSELVVNAYRDSFLGSAGIHIASARAGNVIGGGDWAKDRLVPDILRAHEGGEIVSIRFPRALRPWQHVLEPLAGYLLLAQSLIDQGPANSEAWNFGPHDIDTRSVEWVADYLCSKLSGMSWQMDAYQHPYESSILKLDSAKAHSRLGWSPHWDLAKALDKTLEWHQAWRLGEDMALVMLDQIECYLADGP